MTEQPNCTETLSLVSQLPEHSESNLGLQHHEPELVNIEALTTVDTPILPTSSSVGSGENPPIFEPLLLTSFHQTKRQLAMSLQDAKD